MPRNGFFGWLAWSGRGVGFADAAVETAFRLQAGMSRILGAGIEYEEALLDAALAIDDFGKHRLAFQPDFNIALFHSGWGDGYYASWWGLDAAGAAARLVTSFFVFEAFAPLAAAPPAADPSPHAPIPAANSVRSSGALP